MAKRKLRAAPVGESVRTGPLASDAYDVKIFKRHVDDDPGEEVPWVVATKDWPENVRARVRAVIIAVAAAPPPRFSGGGMWKTMEGSMRGMFEARCKSEGWLYRAYCLLDSDPFLDKTSGETHGKNVLVIISAGKKKNRTKLPENFYNGISGLRDEYLRRTPRSWC